MDEFRQIAELEFDRGFDTVLFGDLGAGADDGAAVRHAALVVVGKIEDKKIFEAEFCDRLGHGATLLGKKSNG
jgi:hypothetical protein